MSRQIMTPDVPIQGTVDSIRTGAPSSRLSWLKLRILSADESRRVQTLMSEERLQNLFEEIACPNFSECSDYVMPSDLMRSQGWPRRCPFYRVDCCHSESQERPEPLLLPDAVRDPDLQYVVVTYEGRDDENSAEAARFLECITAIRAARPDIKVEILTPDFRGNLDRALDVLAGNPPDVFTHILETVPRLYPEARPNASYEGSLDLLRRLVLRFPKATIRSGLRVGLGEELEEVRTLMRDLRTQGCRLLTIGQHLNPPDGKLPVDRYVRPEEFDGLRAYGEHIGFEQVVCGSFARTSCRADFQVPGILSTAKSYKILMTEEESEARGRVTAIGSINHDFVIPGTREPRRYRLVRDNKPIVSRLLPQPG